METREWGLQDAGRKVGWERFLRAYGWGLLVLVLPSLFVVRRVLGVPGMVLYLVLGPGLFWAWSHYGQRWIAAWPKRSVWSIMALSLLFLLVLFAAAYPVLDSGVVGGGSDRDEALNVATQRMLSGLYPYYERTYLDNPISPMPGALLLATPFVVLGNSAYQNFFWLAGYLLLLAHHFGSPASALWRFWAILGLAPVVLQQLFTGGDLPANAIYLVVFCWLLCQQERPFWQRLLAAILVGVGLSSRLNFLVLFLPLAVYLGQTDGLRRAVLLLGLSGITFLLVTLPFYLYDPAGFSPLHTLGRLEEAGVQPPLSWLIPVIGAVLALLIILRRPPVTTNAFFRMATLTLALPILLSLIVLLGQRGLGALPLTGYGVGYLFFGALGVAAE